MRNRRYSLTIWSCFLFCLILAISAAPLPAAPEQKGLAILHWIEQPDPHGPSTTAAPGDRVEFVKILSYDQDQLQDFTTIKASLREGDVIAYRMSRTKANQKIITGHLNAIGYDLLEYGHLAILVQVPVSTDNPTSDTPLRLFSSQSFVGPNTRDGLDTLARHNWDAYRLNQWKRVDTARLHEFVRIVEKKAGHWYGYDFTGMFGLWNSNLRPADPSRIGHEYICSTVVLAALYYAGVQLDAERRNGYIDLCTPLQVLSSPGFIMKPPPVILTTNDIPTSRTIPFIRIPFLFE